MGYLKIKIKTKIKTRIKKLADKKNITMTELAKTSGLTRSVVSGIVGKRSWAVTCEKNHEMKRSEN